MKTQRTTLRSLMLILAGIAIGALAFSNLEFSFTGPADSVQLAARPNYAEAESDIENYPIGSLRSFNEAFVKIAESATPSVVTVYTERTVTRRGFTPFDFFGNPFDDFFGMPELPRSNGQKQVQRGLGSGVIVTADGYILTNNHVIEGADTVSVHTWDDRKLTATVVGTDPKTDIAVLKVAGTALKPIAIGDSDKLRVGEWVIAIGSPLGGNLARTVTQGIVSAKGRANVGLADYEDFIQTDAAINPGNSGGPLVNINGELVGINTAIASRTGGFEGIGFAVPSNMARQVMTSLVTSGKVTRGYLGVSIQDVDENLAKAMRLPGAEGALIGTVVAKSPAEKAGLKSGDVIVEFEERKVKSTVVLRNRIAAIAPGTKVRMAVIRDGKRLSVAARLEEQPSAESAAAEGEPAAGASNRALGFKAAPLTPERAERLGAPAEAKVLVSSVEPGSNAFRAGLRAGDLILAVNRKPVASFDAFTAAVAKAGKGDLLFLLVERRGSRIYLAFNL